MLDLWYVFCCDEDVVRLMRQLFPSSFPISISPLQNPWTRPDRSSSRPTDRPPSRAVERPIIMQLLFEKLCLTVLNLSWYLSKSSQPLRSVPCAARWRGKPKEPGAVAASICWHRCNSLGNKKLTCHFHRR